jgi:N-acetylmuramoyl-L-alanine amidase
MWRELRWIAILLAFAIQTDSIAYAANTQSKRILATSDIRVVSVTPDSAGNFVLLNTLRSKQLPFPTIRYMPSADGHSIMTVDFSGATFEGPQSVLSFEHSGVKQIRIGQVQRFPPIMRISMLADRSEIFGRVDFRSAPGSLTIKLPEEPRSEPANSYDQSQMPQTAPDFARKRKSVNAAPSRAPDAVYLPWTGAKESTPLVDSAAIEPAAPKVLTAKPAPQLSHATRTDNYGKPESGVAEQQISALQAVELAKERQPQRRSTNSEKPPQGERHIANSVSQPSRDFQEKISEQEKPHPGRLKRWFQKFFNDDDQGPANSEQSPTQTISPEPSPQSVPKPAPSIPRKPQPPKRAPAPTTPHATGNKQAPTNTAEQPAIKGAVLKISNSVAKDKFNVTVAGGAKFTYHSFRLSNPDRIVVDITGLEQPTVQLDELTDTSFVRAMRIGNPDQNPLITRVVLDLATPQIADTALLQDPPASTTLTIVLQKLDQVPILTEQRPIKAGTTIVLDAGHGGTDPGAQRGDIQEKAITLEIVDKLRRALESKGIHTQLTRGDDTFVSLEDRVKVTNRLNPDAFVSIHINSLETNTTTTGIETYYQNEQSKDLAKLIHQSLVTGLSAPDRGVRKARFYVINHTPVPAILAEVGFISNKDERDKLISSDYQNQIASAVADGVILFLSEKAQVQPTAANPTPTGSATGSGTISTTAPSASPKSFTQNLQSVKAKDHSENRSQASHHQVPIAGKPKEPRKTKLAQQQLKFKKKRLAATRSL